MRPAPSAQRLSRQQPPLLRERRGTLLCLANYLIPNDDPAALHRATYRGLCLSKQAHGMPERQVASGGIEQPVDEEASGNVDGLASCS